MDNLCEDGQLFRNTLKIGDVAANFCGCKFRWQGKCGCLYPFRLSQILKFQEVVGCSTHVPGLNLESEIVLDRGDCVAQLLVDLDVQRPAFGGELIGNVVAYVVGAARLHFNARRLEDIGDPIVEFALFPRGSAVMMIINELELHPLALIRIVYRFVQRARSQLASIEAGDAVGGDVDVLLRDVATKSHPAMLQSGNRGRSDA